MTQEEILDAGGRESRELFEKYKRGLDAYKALPESEKAHLEVLRKQQDLIDDVFFGARVTGWRPVLEWALALEKDPEVKGKMEGVLEALIAVNGQVSELCDLLEKKDWAPSIDPDKGAEELKKLRRQAWAR